jgi:hypothetical protein
MCHPFNHKYHPCTDSLKLARIPCNTTTNTKRLSSSTTPHQYFIHHTGIDPVAWPAKVVTGQACLSTRLARQAPAGVQSVPYVNAPFDSVRRVHLFCVFARARLFVLLLTTSSACPFSSLAPSRHPQGDEQPPTSIEDWVRGHARTHHSTIPHLSARRRVSARQPQNQSLSQPMLLSTPAPTTASAKTPF